MTEHWQTCLGCARQKVRDLQLKLEEYQRKPRPATDEHLIKCKDNRIDFLEKANKDLQFKVDHANSVVKWRDDWIKSAREALGCGCDEDITTGIANLKKLLRESQDDRIALNVRAVNATNRCEDLKDKVAQLEAKNKNHNDIRNSQANEIIELHGTIKELKDTIEHLKERKAHYKQMAQAEGITNDGADRIIELTKENNLLTADVERLQTELKQSHDRWLETVKANASLGTLSVTVMGEIDTLKQDLAAVRGDCEAFEENFDAIGKKIEALESTIKTAQAEKRTETPGVVELYVGELDELKKQVNAMVGQFNGFITGYHAVIGEMKLSIGQTDEAAEELAHRVETVEETIKEAQKEKRI